MAAVFYGTLSGANTYHSDRGNAAWGAASDPNKTAAMVRASQYIDGRYRQRFPTGRWASMFPGEKTGGRAQVLEWPRTGAVDYAGNDIDSATVPIEVEYATYEAALRELVSPGSLSPDFTPGEQVKREKVDVIEVEYVAPPATVDGVPNRPVIPAIDEIIAPVLLVPARFPGVTVV